MRRLLDGIKAHAAAMDAQAPAARYGTVESVSPVDATVRVTVQPEGVLSGWLPVLQPAVGAGWGVVALPAPGQQVLVLAEYGDSDSGVVMGCAFSARNRPPAVPSLPGGGGSAAVPGEALLVSQAGGVLRLCADGSIYSRGTWRHEGDFSALGDVADRHGTLDRLRGNYNQHGHPGGPKPNPQDPE